MIGRVMHSLRHTQATTCTSSPALAGLFFALGAAIQPPISHGRNGECRSVALWHDKLDPCSEAMPMRC